MTYAIGHIIKQGDKNLSPWQLTIRILSCEALKLKVHIQSSEALKLKVCIQSSNALRLSKCPCSLILYAIIMKKSIKNQKINLQFEENWYALLDVVPTMFIVLCVYVILLLLANIVVIVKNK